MAARTTKGIANRNTIGVFHFLRPYGQNSVVFDPRDPEPGSIPEQGVDPEPGGEIIRILPPAPVMRPGLPVCRPVHFQKGVTVRLCRACEKRRHFDTSLHIRTRMRYDRY